MKLQLVIGIAVSVVGCQREVEATRPNKGATAPSWTESRTAQIYFTTSINGHMDSCALPRLATAIKKGDAPRGLIDAGDLLFPPKTKPAQEQVQTAHALARAFRQLDVLAINVAEGDLAGGVQLLKKLQREGAVPFVSANIRPASPTGPAIARSRSKIIGGIKIGFTGVATPEKVASCAPSGEVTPLEYAPALLAEVRMLRKQKAELIIVLAHVTDREAQDLARTVPDIDILIRSPGSDKPKAPYRSGQVVITEAGNRLSHVGRITLHLGEGAFERPLKLGDQEEPHMRIELIELDQQIAADEQMKVLVAGTSTTKPHCKGAVE